MNWVVSLLCVALMGAAPSTQPMHDEDAGSFVAFAEYFAKQLDAYQKQIELLARRQGQELSDSSAELIDYDVVHSPSVLYPLVGSGTFRSTFSAKQPGGGVTVFTDTYRLQFGIKEGHWQAIKSDRVRRIESSPRTNMDGETGDVEKPDRYNRILADPVQVATEEYASTPK